MIDHGLASNPWHVNSYNPPRVTQYLLARINLAVLEAGEYTLSLRFSDGATRTWPVDLPVERNRRQCLPASIQPRAWASSRSS